VGFRFGAAADDELGFVLGEIAAEFDVGAVVAAQHADLIGAGVGWRRHGDVELALDQHAGQGSVGAGDHAPQRFAQRFRYLARTSAGTVLPSNSCSLAVSPLRIVT